MKSWQKLTLILLGNFMIAFGVSFFLVPAGLISGGATGMALVLHKAFGLPMTVGIWGVSTPGHMPLSIPGCRAEGSLWRTASACVLSHVQLL